MLVQASGSVGSPAGPEGDPSSLEVAEELLPFHVGLSPVFLAGTGGTAAGDEGAVAVDDLLGIDRLVPHGGSDVAVADHELGDVGRHPVQERVRDEQPAEIVGREQQRAAVGIGEAEDTSNASVRLDTPLTDLTQERTLSAPAKASHSKRHSSIIKMEQGVEPC